jgi:opacity protein-like surface antigen
MKTFALAAALLVFAGVASAAGAPPPPDANQVKGKGCVQAGVEAGCLVVKDSQNGKLFSLLIKGAKPAIGAGIDFAGAPFSGMTTCTQGPPIQIQTWSHNETLQCSRGKGKSVQ